MSSWADIAAKNAPPEELQAHPDPNLLERKEDHPSHKGEAAVDYEGEHVHVVDQSEVDKLREAIGHADDSHVEDDFARARRHQQERDQQANQARLKSEALRELKHDVAKVESEAERGVERGATEARRAVDDAKRDVEDKADKAKEVARDKLKDARDVAEDKFDKGKRVAEDKFDQGKRDAKEFANKAEKEIKKDARKVQKKAGEVEREGRDLARRYPYAATGIVGLVNAALIAVPAYYAYQNWHHPRWDRRVVSAVAVGLTAAFGAEGALGWFEYKEGHRPNL